MNKNNSENTPLSSETELADTESSLEMLESQKKSEPNSTLEDEEKIITINENSLEPAPTTEIPTPIKSLTSENSESNDHPSHDRIDNIDSIDTVHQDDLSEQDDEPLWTTELTDEKRAWLSASMETILFLADKPLGLPKLKSLIASEYPIKIYRQLMADLRQKYQESCHGIEIAELALGFQFRTKPHMAPVLRNMVKTVPLKLTPPMMEVLAIIAYQQPVTKDQIDQLRGVDSGHLIRALMEKRLLRVSGRSELPGKPSLYSTTHEFLELFSLKDTSYLQPLHEMEALIAANEVGSQEQEGKNLERFGRMVEQSLATPLFEVGDLDLLNDEIKQVIDAIPTSTEYIDEQKSQEKAAAKILAGAQLTGTPVPTPIESPTTQEPETESATKNQNPDLGHSEP